MMIGVLVAINIVVVLLLFASPAEQVAHPTDLMMTQEELVQQEAELTPVHEDKK